MKKYFTRFMALVCCLAATLTASAQFSATIEMYPMSSYNTMATSFSLTEVATTLNTDAATLVATLDEWVAAETVETNYIFLGSKDAEGATNYTQGGRGQFWMDKEGNAVNWGLANGSCWYNMNSWSLDNDTYTIEVGQYPDTLVVGDELKAHFILSMNEKDATFDITLKVIEKPVVDIPTPVISISQLNIVGQQNVEVRQYPRGDYTSTNTDVDLSGVAALLGVDNDLIASNLKDLLFTTTMIENEEKLLIKTDSLSNESSAGGIGWWYAQVYDMENQIPSDEVARAVWGNPTLTCFFESFSYDAETTTLSCNVGQNGGTLEVGDQRIVHVYLIYGDKAYHITYTLIIEEKPVGPVVEREKVGEQNLEVSFVFSPTDYAGTIASVNLEEIAQLLEAQVSSVSFQATDKDGTFTDASSANNKGFWLNEEGFRCSYGEGYFFIEPTEDGVFTTFSIGQYPGKLEAGRTYTATLYFVNIDNNKYYQLNLIVHVTEKPEIGVTFNSVATRPVMIQAIPSTNSYAIEMEHKINTAEYEELIGTSTPKLFATAKPKEGDTETKYSDAYSCDPKPGFYMTEDGYAGTWGAGDPWAFSFVDNERFIFFQYPGKNQVGDVRKGNVYLVNMETGDMITYSLTVRFVSEMEPQVEEVGSETLILPATDGMTLDLTAAIDSLGLKELEEPIDATGLLSTPCLLLPNADGTFTDPLEATTGAYLNEQGYFDESEENAEGVFYIYFEANDENSITLVAQEENGFQLTKDKHIQTKFALQYGEKMYVFNVTFVDADTYTGVADVKNTSVKNANVFDLTGRRVKDAAQRGIFIQNGKKVLR